METKATNDFLGTGWSSPPTFVKGYNGALMSSGEQNVKESLNNLLNTHLGERPFISQFGTKLRSYAFTAQTAIAEGDLKASIRSSINTNEPRVIVDTVTLELLNTAYSLLLIKVDYTLITVNTRHNFVYPFYLNEGTHLNLP